MEKVNDFTQMMGLPSALFVSKNVIIWWHNCDQAGLVVEAITAFLKYSPILLRVLLKQKPQDLEKTNSLRSRKLFFTKLASDQGCEWKKGVQSNITVTN